MTAKEQILCNMTSEIKSLLENVDFTELEEIRLRSGKQLTLCFADRIKKLPYTVTQSEIEQTLHIISGASVYAYLEEIKNCFITLEGGHRAGICGRTIVQGGEVTNVVQISGINFRIARQIKGAADRIMNYITKNGIQNTLIISPPQCGKTTILRDAARQLGKSFKVSVIDERGEISAMHCGVPQNDVGEMTDTLDLCPKAIGIPLMLRSMSPDIIVTDEIAQCDIEAIKQALSCGVKIIATAHGDNKEQVLKRLQMSSVIEEFGCIITLSRRNGPGTIECIN